MATLHERGRELGVRLAWDESRQGLERDPWLMVLPGSRGQVFVWGEGQWAFSCGVHMALKLRREVAGVQFVQEGDDGVNATFPDSALPEVARRLKLYRKRKYSPEQRAKMAERLAAFRAETQAN